jgi:hypothetical protein
MSYAQLSFEEIRTPAAETAPTRCTREQCIVTPPHPAHTPGEETQTRMASLDSVSKSLAAVFKKGLDADVQAGPTFAESERWQFLSDSKKSSKERIMKRNLCLVVLVWAATSVFGADAGPKDEITDAAKKLGDTSYAWKTVVEFGNFTGTTEGKTDKEGLVGLSMNFGDNSTQAFVKGGGKGAVKTQDGDWQSLAELEASTEQGPQRFLVRRLQAFKAPATEVSELAGKTKELKKDGQTYSADLTEAGAKELLSFGRRGGNAAEPKNAKGSVKFWIKDGALTKYVLNVQGSVNFNGEDRDVDRTTTTEIKDVGSVKLEVPEAAKKKLG